MTLSNEHPPYLFTARSPWCRASHGFVCKSWSLYYSLWDTRLVYAFIAFSILLSYSVLSSWLAVRIYIHAYIFVYCANSLYSTEMCEIMC